MSRIWIIAKMSLLENSRKQVFHVLCLLMLTVIAGSTLLSFLTDGVKLKILKDLCLTCVLFGGAVIAIALASSGIPNDVEMRTIYPIIARPITRLHYITGKYLGTLLTVAMGILAMSAVFGILIFSYGGFDSFLITAMLFTLLEIAIIAAVATALSTVASPAVTAVITFLVYICGSIKIGYFGEMIEKTGNGLPKTAFGLIYHILPNLECFNLKNALVHNDPVPASYLIQVALYGVCYIAFVLFLGSIAFMRKEV